MPASHSNGPLSGIQLSELRRQGATLSLVYRGSLCPDQILYGLLSGFLDARQERLRSRRLFVSSTRNLLDNLAGLDIRASQWTNYRWNAKYCENTSRLRVFIPKTSARPVGMSLARTAWVKLNRLAPLKNCECGAIAQTADDVLITCPYIGHHMMH